jgi:hypothetical protein
MLLHGFRTTNLFGLTHNVPMTTEGSRDHMSAWMSALKAVGVDTGILIGRLDQDQPEPFWYSLPHSDFDGIGAFVTLLREHGHRDLETPASTHTKIPSIADLLRAAGRFTALAMRSGSSTLAAPTTTAEPRRVAWSVFGREQTTDLRTRAKQQHVSLNSLLLYTLDRACEPLLARHSRFSRWMIPINMRGLTHGPRDTANHVTYVRIHVSPHTSLQSIHDQFRSHVEGSEHWWLWHCYRYGSFVGPAIMRFLARVDLRFGNPLIGTFSNLGNWNLSGQSRWLFCPPVAKASPLGAGCVTYDGQLGIALQIEPHYENAGTLAEATMKKWIREIDSLAMPC